MRLQAFEIHEPTPKLRETHAIAMLRPWLDAGNVGTLSLGRLEEHFESQEVGRLIKPGTFFDFTRYRPMTRTVEGRRTLTLPNSTITLIRPEDPPDFLLLHLMEPHAFAEEYIDSVVEVVKCFGVKRYCRIGGMYNAVPHTRPLRVTGTLAGEPLRGVAGVSTQRGSYQGPTSIMNLVSEATDKLGVESLSLMVHLPQYLELEEDHAGKARLLEVLCAIYGLPAEIAQTEMGEQQYREVSVAVDRNPAIKALVQRLESYYDSRTEWSQPEEALSLSPEIERFLQDMGEKLDGSS